MSFRVSWRALLAGVVLAAGLVLAGQSKALTPEQAQLKTTVLSVLDGVRDESSKDAPVRLVFEPKTRTIEQQEYNPESQMFETVQVELPGQKTIVNGINYYGFVVPLIELCKQQQARIEALEARLTAAGIP